MWLLDVNLPTGLIRLLRGIGIACDSTIQRGWRALANGELASAAFASGFRVILTRDREFGASANLQAFEAKWQERRITPIPGTVVEWP